MNLDSTNKYSIFNKTYSLGWKNLLRFEFFSLWGRSFASQFPPKTTKNILNLGCGSTYIDGWVNADFFYFSKLLFWKKQPKIDWMLDLRYPLKCKDNYWDGVFTEHTFEHLHPADAFNLFKELNRTMKKDAWIRICVPGLDEALKGFDQPLSEEGKWMREELGFSTRAEIIWHLTQNWAHFAVWDSELMSGLLQKAGFSNCKKVQFMEGEDTALLKDNLSRKVGSMYLEAQKI